MIFSNPTTPSAYEWYKELHALYYYHKKSKVDPTRYRFIEGFVKEAKDGQILDAIAGIGAYLLPLAAQGIKVVGINFSGHMIEQTNELARKRGISIKLEQHSLLETKPDFDKRFSLVLVTGTWFGMFCQTAQIKLALKNIISWLKPNGRLVVGVQTEFDLPENPSVLRRCDDLALSNGNHLIFEKLEDVFDIAGHRIRRAQCFYTLANARGDKILEERETLDWKLYKTGEMESFLAEAGFVNIKSHKAFECGKTPDKNDKIIIYEGVRPLEGLE